METRFVDSIQVNSSHYGARLSPTFKALQPGYSPQARCWPDSGLGAGPTCQAAGECGRSARQICLTLTPRRMAPGPGPAAERNRQPEAGVLSMMHTPLCVAVREGDTQVRPLPMQPAVNVVGKAWVSSQAPQAANVGPSDRRTFRYNASGETWYSSTPKGVLD